MPGALAAYDQRSYRSPPQYHLNMQHQRNPSSRMCVDEPVDGATQILQAGIQSHPLVARMNMEIMIHFDNICII